MKRRSFLARSIGGLIGLVGGLNWKPAWAASRPIQSAKRKLPPYDDIRASMAWSEHQFFVDPQLAAAREQFIGRSPWDPHESWMAVTYGNAISGKIGATSRIATTVWANPRDVAIDKDASTGKVTYRWTSFNPGLILHPARHVAFSHLVCNKPDILEPWNDCSKPVLEIPPLAIMGKDRLLQLLRDQREPRKQPGDLRAWLRTARPGNVILIQGQQYLYVSHAVYMLELQGPDGKLVTKDIDHLIQWQMYQLV